MAYIGEGFVRFAFDAVVRGGNVATQPTRRVLSWFSARRIGEIGAAVLLIAATIYQLLDHSAQVQGVVDATASAAAAQRYDEVYERLSVAGLDISERGAARLIATAAGTVSLTSEPSGATVFATRIQPISSYTGRRPFELGRTPIRGRPLVAGQYLVRITAPGHETVELVVTADVGKDVRVSRTLLPAGDSVMDAMVHVDEGVTRAAPDGRVAAFTIGKFEVTNAQYMAFVEAGGYEDTTLWPATMISRGRALPRRLVMNVLVDRSGEPGPKFWVEGTFPEGEEDYPVIGVSWYEAAAYAKWAGYDLPTRAQWYRAAVGDRNAFPWGTDPEQFEARANFGLIGTMAVGSFPLGISPFGCYDMAGNAREWLADSAPSGRRYSAGGSWQEGLSSFDARHAEALDPAFRGRATGFRLAAPVLSAEP